MKYMTGYDLPNLIFALVYYNYHIQPKGEKMQHCNKLSQETQKSLLTI